VKASEIGTKIAAPKEKRNSNISSSG